MIGPERVSRVAGRMQHRMPIDIADTISTPMDCQELVVPARCGQGLPGEICRRVAGASSAATIPPAQDQ